MDTSANEYLKGVIEAILFISDKPVLLDQIKDVMDESVGGVADVRKLVEELKDEYESKQRGMVIVEIAGGYQMLSSQHYATYIRHFLKTKVREKLSRPALETLAIIAYKQPVSRSDVEVIRGVNSDGVVLHLLNKGHIKIVGKKDVPGRPFLYGTTKLFLEYFGLKSLNDLPKLEDVSLLIAKTAEQATEASQESLGESADVSKEEIAANASQALDAAEAKAASENAELQDVAEAPVQPPAEHVPTTESYQVEALEEGITPSDVVERHIRLAQEHVEELIIEDVVNEPISENPMSLKEAMDELGQDAQHVQNEGGRIQNIIADEHNQHRAMPEPNLNDDLKQQTAEDESADAKDA